MASTVATICPLLGPLSTVCKEPSLFLLMHYMCVCLPNRLTKPGHASARPDVQVDPFIHGSAMPHVASLCPARHCVACAKEGVEERKSGRGTFWEFLVCITQNYGGSFIVC